MGSILSTANTVILRHVRAIEMVCVLVRICSFSLVSWLGPDSPFFAVWALNTADAVMLTWCALLRKEPAYTVLNIFWVGVGIIGMYRATAFVH